MMRRLLQFFFLILPVMTRATAPIVHNTTTGIELKNNRASIVLSNDAELISIIDLRTNTDIADKNKKKVAYVKTIEGSIIEASRLSLKDDILVFNIGDNCIELKVKALDDYFTFEVQNEKVSGIKELTFIDLKLNTGVVETGQFCASGVAMSLQTNPVNYPSSENKEVVGQCTIHTGLLGSKLAIVACPKEELWDIIKSVYHNIPPHSVPILSSGGAFAHEGGSNRDDCVIVNGSDVQPEEIPGWIDFYTSIGVRQIAFNIGLGYYTCNQGQFNFTTLGSAEAFREQISDPLNEAGIISILHTYSYYISYSSNEILSNPQWQQQLEFRGEHILLNEITPDASVIDVIGDISYIEDIGGYYSVFTPFILIDEEIIRYEIGKDGFVSCKRGQCGTLATSHAKGTKVRIIGGYFYCIAPKIGSDLFYEIARRTAVAYNEGGFKGFYFDAIDGLSNHLKYYGLNDYLWYYGASFINEVLKYCESEPLVVEMSNLYPTMWSARGRGECWDTPKRGYKVFIDEHTSGNEFLIKHQYIGTLGWYDFYPMRNDQPEDFSTKYMFCDDVDYLGVKAIAYDQTMVYNRLFKMQVDSCPALRRNLELYTKYNRLRAEGYFKDSLRDILKKGKYEYQLASKKGIWGFNEVVYCRTKIRDVMIDNASGNNPFERQKPFIRLENLYTSDLSSAINLMQFDENVDVMAQNTEKSFSSALDLSGHLGLRVTIMGNGSNSKDALCFRLRSFESSSGYADYIVRLNFEGWRDIILPNLDNAEYPELNFKKVGFERYKIHRNDVDYSNIKIVQVLSSGECKGVKVKRIDAVPIVANPVNNPTVVHANASIKFLDTIQSGEYIEYNVGEKKAFAYDRQGNKRIVNIKRKRRFRIPNGNFSTSVTGDWELKKATPEVVLTIGLLGAFIHN